MQRFIETLFGRGGKERSEQAAREAEAALDDALEEKLANAANPLSRLLLVVAEGETRTKKLFCFKIEQEGEKENVVYVARRVKRGREGDLTHWAERGGFTCTGHETREKGEIVLTFTYSG